MKRFKKMAALLFGLILFTGTVVLAAPFAKTIQFEQPDGTQISLWGQGDDFYAVFETLDGYTVTYDPTQKTYFYATVSADGTQLLATNLEVGKSDPRTLGLGRHLRITGAAVAQQAKTRRDIWDLGMENSRRWSELKSTRRALEASKSGTASEPVVMSPPSFTTTGQKVGLCLLIDFDNDPASIPQAEIIDFCNGDNFTRFGNNGSVKKYFLDNSNNMLTYSNVVTAYIRIPNSLHPKSYYNNTSQDAGLNANRMIRDAITIMRALPNYATQILPAFAGLTVDSGNNVMACNVFYAGGNGNTWSYGLWPHSWSLYDVGAQSLSTGGMKVNRYQVSNIGNSLEIATFCHENGHMLCGYPDLYDYDYDSTGGAGQFCLMAYGTQNGNNPVQICAYLKYVAGWATTVEVDSTMALAAELTAPLGSEGFNRFCRYVKPGTNTEYYLFENRQKTGRDVLLPAAGVAIWHIDELGDRDNQSLAYNATHSNYECTLVQADNLWDFEHYANSGDSHDLYYAGNSAAAYANEFNDASSPSARWWDGSASKMKVIGISASADTMSFSFVIMPPVMLYSGELPPGRVSAAYSYTLGAVGGVPPYTWSVVSNGLPAGLTLSSAGVISGIPLEETNTVFDVAVMCASNVAATNQFSLMIRPVNGVPFTETFENGGLLPDSWTQEYVTGTKVWSFITGSPQGFPKGAHTGSFNACIASASTSGTVTRLVSPRLDFGPGTNHVGQLTFWQYMGVWGNDTDELRVYYKTAAGKAWTLVPGATYTAYVGEWTQRTVTLPTPSSTYYIAFEGTAKFGYGVCVDDITVIDTTRYLQALPIPFAENFENAGTMPAGWSQSYVSGSLDWVFLSGSKGGQPASSHEGNYNACLFVDEERAYTSRLVSPMLDLGTNMPNPRLSFWLCNQIYDGDQDELRVYYRTSPSGSWTLLTNYLTNVSGWTQQTVSLPNRSSTYYIAFEGKAQWGYGVCIDDVLVTGDASPYMAWQIGKFTPGELLDKRISGDLADPDGDGIVNALEFAMGLDPRRFDTAGFPTGGVIDQHLFLTYRENKAASNIVFAVETCTSLINQDWTTNGVIQNPKVNSNTWWQVMDWHNMPVTNAPQRFMRLKVYLP